MYIYIISDEVKYTDHWRIIDVLMHFWVGISLGWDITKHNKKNNKPNKFNSTIWKKKKR